MFCKLKTTCFSPYFPFVKLETNNATSCNKDNSLCESVSDPSSTGTNKYYPGVCAADDCFMLCLIGLLNILLIILNQITQMACA